jgi:hypothetical protein
MSLLLAYLVLMKTIAFHEQHPVYAIWRILSVGICVQFYRVGTTVKIFVSR